MNTTKKDPEVVNTKKEPEVVNTKKEPEVARDLWPLTRDICLLTLTRKRTNLTTNKRTETKKLKHAQDSWGILPKLQ